jgi:hypothetical protein
MYLARPYVYGEDALPTGVILFADNGAGVISEINLMIVKRTRGGRHRLFLAATGQPSLNTDLEIVTFLRARGINPRTLKANA